jgi:hypothetical protein
MYCVCFVLVRRERKILKGLVITTIVEDSYFRYTNSVTKNVTAF